MKCTQGHTKSEMVKKFKKILPSGVKAAKVTMESCPICGSPIEFEGKELEKGTKTKSVNLNDDEEKKESDTDND